MIQFHFIIQKTDKNRNTRTASKRWQGSTRQYLHLKLSQITNLVISALSQILHWLHINRKQNKKTMKHTIKTTD